MDGKDQAIPVSTLQNEEVRCRVDMDASCPDQRRTTVVPDADATKIAYRRNRCPLNGSRMNRLNALTNRIPAPGVEESTSRPPRSRAGSPVRNSSTLVPLWDSWAFLRLSASTKDLLASSSARCSPLQQTPYSLRPRRTAEVVRAPGLTSTRPVLPSPCPR